MASERVEPPRVERITELAPNKKLVGSSFRQQAAIVFAFLSGLSADECEAIQAQLQATGKYAFKGSDNKEYVLTKDMVTLTKTERTVFEDRYAPTVIEPSFGIGRIVYSVMEHSYWVCVVFCLR